MHFALVPPLLALEEVFERQEQLALSAKTLADRVVGYGDHVSSLLQAGLVCAFIRGAGLVCTAGGRVLAVWGESMYTRGRFRLTRFLVFLGVKEC